MTFEDVLFVTAQPDVPYFHWQVRVYIENFINLGISPENIHVIFGIVGKNNNPSEESLKLSSLGVQIHHFKDERVQKYYIPSIKPFLIYKWLEKNPEEAQKLLNAGIPGIRYLDGGSRGIGAAVVRQLAAQGTAVLFSYRREAAAAQALAQGGPPELLVQSLQDVRAQAQRASEIVRRIRGMVRQGSGLAERFGAAELVDTVLGWLKPEITARRELSFWSYQLGEVVGGPTFSRHSETLEYIGSLGFPVNPEIRVVGGLDEATAFCLQWQQHRQQGSCDPRVPARQSG